MGEKRRFTAGTFGKVSILLASALKSRYVFTTALLVAAAAVMQLAGGGLLQSAYADTEISQMPVGNSYHRSLSESMSVTTMYGSGSPSAPVSHYRSISESMSVTSAHGSSPASYSRSMSEQASLTTNMPSSSAPAVAQQPRAPSTTPYSANSNQRIDERFNLRNSGGSKIDDRSLPSGTPAFSTDTAMAGFMSGSGADITIFDTASVDGGEEASDDSSSLQYILAEMDADLYGAGYVYATNIVFAAQSLAVVAIALSKSPVARRARTSNFRILIAMFSSPSKKAPTETRVMVILVVLFSAAVAATSFGSPILGEAAGDTNKAAAVYIEGSTPVYREWIPAGGGGGAWSSPLSLTAADTTLNTVKIEFSPTTSKRVIVTMDANGALDSYVCYSACTTLSSWTHGDNFADVATAAVTASYRPWDIEFEQTSGDLVVVYDYVEAGSSATDDLFYRSMTDAQTAFGSESSINDSGNAATAGLYSFVALDSQKTTGSDEMAFIALDVTGLDASVIVWNGNNWTTLPQTELSTGLSIATEEAVAIAYETSSGDILAVAGEGAAAVRHNTFSNSLNTWGTSSTSTGTWAVGALNWVRLVPDPRRSSSAIFLGGLGGSGDIDSAYWSGSAWTDHTEHDAGVTGHDKRYFDFVWDGSSLNGALMWSTATTSISFTRGDPSSVSFGTDGTFTVDTAQTVQWIRLVPNPTTSDTVAALGLESDGSSDIGGIRWDGGSNSPVSTGTDDITTTSTNNSWEPFDVDFQKVPVSRSMSESIGISDNIARIKTNVRSVSEQAGVTDSAARAQILGRSAAEQIGAVDSIVGARSFTKSVSEQAAVSDGIDADQTFAVSVAEQLGLQDKMKRDRNGYSAGTVYRSDTGEFGLDSVKYKQWDPTANIWSTEVELPDSGSEVRDAKILFSPVSEMRVVITHGADGTLDLFSCNAFCTLEDSWTLEEANFADTHDDIASPDPTKPFRYFDAAFKEQNGDLLVVYDRDQNEPLDFYYRTWDGATLSPVSGFDLQNLGGLVDTERISYFHLAAKPNSNEMAMVLLDHTKQDVHALIFDAVSGSPSMATKRILTTSMGSTSIDGDSIGIAYDAGSGGAAAFAGNGADSLAYATWNGASWSSASTVDPNTGSAGNDVKFMTVTGSPDPSSGAIMICQVDDLLDLTCAEMENGALGSFTLMDSDVNTSASRAFDFIWSQIGNAGILVWGTTADVVDTSIWNGASWVAPATTAINGTSSWITGLQAASAFETARAVFLSKNTDSDIGSLGIVGSSLLLIGHTTHTVDASGTVFEGMDIDWHVAGVRQPFRLPVESMAVADTVSITIGKYASDSLTMTESARLATTKPLSDNLTVTDAISRPVSKNLSDQLAVTDTIAKTTPKSLVEQLAVTDTIARSFTGSRSTTEQLALAETISMSASKSMAEQISLSDTIERGFTITESITEQLGMTEAVTKAVSKSMAEQLAVTETAARTIVQSRTVSDQLAVTETVSTISVRILSEQMAVTDTIVRTIVTARSVAEQLAATDAVTPSSPRQLAEQLTVEDTIARSLVLSRAMAESLSVQETVTKTASVSLTEQMAIAETANRAIVTSRSMSELAAVTDAIAVTTSRSMTEQMAVSDIIARNIVATRAVSEEIILTDTATPSSFRQTTEQLALTDEIQRSIITARTMAEQLTTTETVFKVVSVTLTEQLAASDTLARSADQSVSLTEQLGMTEGASKSATMVLSEEIEVTDDVARSVVITRSMSEQMAITDTVSKTFTANLAEQMGVSDEIARTVVQSRSMAEQLLVTDLTSKSIFKTMTEQIAVEDDAVRTTNLTRSASETLSVQDTITKSSSVSLAEQMTVTDTIARSVQQEVSVAEQLTLTDAIAASIEKPLSDSLAVTDTIARSVTQSRSIAEAIVMQDTITASNARTLAETLAMADTVVAASVVSRSTSEELVITDEVSVVISRSMTDQLTITDAIARSVIQSRSMDEQMVVTDTAAKSATMEMTEQLGLSETAARGVLQAASMTEQLDMTESISTSVAKNLSDNLSLSEVTTVTAPGAASESLSITESISATVSKPLSEQLGISDAIAIALAMSLAEQMAVSDSITAIAAGEVFVTDQLAATESISIIVSKQVADSLALSDALMTTGSIATSESMTLTDAIARSVIIARAASESMAIADSVTAAPAVFIFVTDSMSVGDAFTDISIVFNLSLPELLVLAQGFATHIEGFFDQPGNEGIVMGDSVVLVLQSVAPLSETMVLQDQIKADQINGRTPSEQMGMSDSMLMIVLRPPPPPPVAVTTMPNLMITETKNVNEFKGLTNPTKATQISGSWNIANLNEANLQNMLTAMNMPVYDVSEEANSGDIDDLTMVLPTFWVSMEGGWEDDAGFLTPTLSHLPAGMEVIVPINVKDSMEGDENLDMLGNMTINFTAAESATDFTLLVTVLDDNPESDISDNPPNDIPAFFIDVTIIGDFPDLTPDTEAFFENPPELTFTLTEEWAVEQDTNRDGNNVPIIGLFLLDEGDGSWLELTSELESPLSAVDDTYTYRATLPHFSTYVVTAGETGGGTVSTGGSGGGGTQALTVTRQIAESLLVTVLVDDGGEETVRDLVDSLSVLDRQSPLHERIISVQNVTVTVGLADIEAAAFGTAEATLTFEITNKNGETEEILLRYFYNDPVTGQKAYDEKQTVTIGPHDTITHFVDIPFSSSGVFDVMIEVESDDGMIASTDIVIDIPWLEVNIFVLTVVIVGVVSAPVAIVAYALRQGLLPRNAGGRPEDIALALMQAAIAAGLWIMRALARRRRRSGAVRHPAGGIAKRRMSLYAIARKVGRILAAGIGRASRFFWLIARRRRSKEEEEAVERLLGNRRPGEQIIGALKRVFKFIFRRRA